jgi:hypothetical protein
MSLKKRVDRLLAGARQANPACRGGGRTRLLKGLAWEAVLEAVAGAVGPPDRDLLDAILAHVEEAARTPRRHPSTGEPWRTEGGKQLYETHHFVYWLWGLQAGSWALPEPLPRAALEGFRGRYGAILWRCEACLTALANGGRYATCPTCGSSDLSHKKLGGSEGVSHWQYTPLSPPERTSKASR